MQDESIIETTELSDVDVMLGQGIAKLQDIRHDL